MKNFKILESDNGYFYIVEKIEKDFFEYSYFQHWLKFLFGIRQKYWSRDYYNQFKSYKDALEYINEML